MAHLGGGQLVRRGAFVGGRQRQQGSRFLQLLLGRRLALLGHGQTGLRRRLCVCGGWGGGVEGRRGGVWVRRGRRGLGPPRGGAGGLGPCLWWPWPAGRAGRPGPGPSPRSWPPAPPSRPPRAPWPPPARPGGSAAGGAGAVMWGLRKGPGMGWIGLDRSLGRNYVGTR